MIVENINKKKPVLKVLIAPLDWGLGHATRCIPIINTLIDHNVEVILAAEADAAQILGKAQPKLVILRLKGYRVKYSRSMKLFLFQMFLQFPKIIAAIYYERRWLKKTIAEHKIDAVISDNRFGLYNPSVCSVFITHQLCIKTGNKWMDKLAQKINYRFINKFDECWIPDGPTDQNLAGELSHPKQFPTIPVRYLGILSRFKKLNTEKIYDLLVMLSGPEPQRTIFENMLLPQLKNIPGSVVLVRGLPGKVEKLSFANDKLVIYNHLPAGSLNELIEQAKTIVARCGYSTVMDLFTLQQKAILVPTPGQTEQEYLAKYLMEKKLFFCCSQQDFSLQSALDSLNYFESPGIINIPGLQEQLIGNWINDLKNKFMA